MRSMSKERDKQIQEEIIRAEKKKEIKEKCKEPVSAYPHVSALKKKGEENLATVIVKLVSGAQIWRQKVVRFNENRADPIHP